MFKRITAIVTIATFLSTLGPLPPAFALRPTSEGKSAQAVGDALQASGAAAAGAENITPEVVSGQSPAGAAAVGRSLPQIADEIAQIDKQLPLAQGGLVGKENTLLGARKELVINDLRRQRVAVLEELNEALTTTFDVTHTFELDGSQLLVRNQDAELVGAYDVTTGALISGAAAAGVVGTDGRGTMDEGRTEGAVPNVAGYSGNASGPRSITGQVPSFGAAAGRSTGSVEELVRRLETNINDERNRVLNLGASIAFDRPLVDTTADTVTDTVTDAAIEQILSLIRRDESMCAKVEGLKTALEVERNAALTLLGILKKMETPEHVYLYEKQQSFYSECRGRTNAALDAIKSLILPVGAARGAAAAGAVQKSIEEALQIIKEARERGADLLYLYMGSLIDEIDNREYVSIKGLTDEEIFTYLRAITNSQYSANHEAVMIAGGSEVIGVFPVPAVDDKNTRADIETYGLSIARTRAGATAASRGQGEAIEWVDRESALGVVRHLINTKEIVQVIVYYPASLRWSWGEFLAYDREKSVDHLDRNTLMAYDKIKDQTAKWAVLRKGATVLLVAQQVDKLPNAPKGAIAETDLFIKDLFRQEFQLVERTVGAAAAGHEPLATHAEAAGLGFMASEVRNALTSYTEVPDALILETRDFRNNGLSKYVVTPDGRVLNYVIFAKVPEYGVTTNTAGTYTDPMDISGEYARVREILSDPAVRAYLEKYSEERAATESAVEIEPISFLRIKLGVNIYQVRPDGKVLLEQGVAGRPIDITNDSEYISVISMIRFNPHVVAYREQVANNQAAATELGRRLRTRVLEDTASGKNHITGLQVYLTPYGIDARDPIVPEILRRAIEIAHITDLHNYAEGLADAFRSAMSTEGASLDTMKSTVKGFFDKGAVSLTSPEAGNIIERTTTLLSSIKEAPEFARVASLVLAEARAAGAGATSEARSGILSEAKGAAAGAAEIRAAAERCPVEGLSVLQDANIPENTIIAVPGILFTDRVNLADLAMLPEIVGRLHTRNVTLVISGLDEVQQDVLTGWVGEKGLYFDGSVSKPGYDASRYATNPITLCGIAKELKVDNVYTLYPREPGQRASDSEIHRIDERLWEGRSVNFRQFVLPGESEYLSLADLLNQALAPAADPAVIIRAILETLPAGLAEPLEDLRKAIRDAIEASV